MRFELGRATVRLSNGILMSVISPDRNPTIRDAQQWAVSEWDVVDALAGEDSYEVGFLIRVDPVTFSDFAPAGWEGWWRMVDGEPVYAFVPRQVVEDYAAKHHAHEPDAEQDSDNQWEPRCAHCAVLSEEPFLSTLHRYPTAQLGVAAARDVLTMIGEGDGN